MEPLRIRGVVVLVASMLAVSAPELVRAQPPADAVRFAVDVEKARAHLLAQYGTTVTNVGRTLDDAVTRVVGADIRATPAFRIKVLALAGMADEYDEAFKDGRITQAVEYQDAYAFFRRAKTLYDVLPADARRADADMGALAKAFASREPPKTPMPAKTVKDLTQRIGTTLTK